MGMLRILLAISVLTAHLSGKSILSFRLLHGDLAVQSFFMISGFYMALVLNQKYRPGQYWVFLQQRWLRLMPVYWVILALYVAAAALFSGPLLPRHPLCEGWLSYGHVPNVSALACLAFLNLFLIGNEWLYFLAVNPASGSLFFSLHASSDPIWAFSYSVIGPAWTLSLEMMFYLLAPFLVRKSWRVQAGIVLACMLLRWSCAGLSNLSPGFFDNRFFPFELGFFMAGSVAYQVYTRYGGVILQAASRWQWARWFFYFIVIAYSRLPGTDFIHYHVFVVMLFIMLPVLFALTKNLAWDRLTGELSYSFYLSHPLILVLIEPLVSRLPLNLWGFAYLLACLCFSYLIYRFFEAKVDRWRESLLHRPVPPVAVTATPAETT